MIKNQILEDLKTAVLDLGYKVDDTVFRGTRKTVDTVLSIPKNSDFGDYSTNIALQLSKLDGENGKQNPLVIAKAILEKLGNKDYLEKAEVAGGGFINFFIKDEELIKILENPTLEKSESPEKILVEYGHVNPLKEIHIGHLRTFILGESICRVLESVGNKVFRANYQGDIGLHIAKAIWGIQKVGLPSEKLSNEEKADFLGKAYAQGNTAYEADPKAKEEIDHVNKKLYQKDPEVKEVYQLARSWSLEYFEPIYELLGTRYDRCFFESEVYETGKKTVLDNIGKVFIENDGAVIFPGEKYGLHSRVFITSKGNPTYEGKEMGLAELEYDTFKYDKSVHVVASEQEGYFQVVIKAIELIFPNLVGKKTHMSYGLVDLKEGKMSSRTGDVVTVNDLYQIISEKVREVMKQSRLDVDQSIIGKVALGAIKFSYLKYSPSPNMVFSIQESVSLEGDSGPYVQYTYARIQSVIKKAKVIKELQVEESLEKEERQVLVKLLYFAEVVKQVSETYHPNLLATYLLDLSKSYNFFYQKMRIIGTDKENFRLVLSRAVGEVLSQGLNLLGIEAPEKM